MRLVRALIVTIAAAAFAVVGCTASGGAAPAQLSGAGCTIPAAVAHRGGYADVGRTEDTVGAYVKAHAYGLDEWETDVRFDRNGVPYLMHNSPIDETTNGTGWASSVDIATTTVKMNDGTLLRDQTLDRLLSYAAKYQATVAIEPKVVPTAAQAQRVENVIDKHGMRTRVLIDSFHTANLAPLKAVAPDLTYSLVTDHVVTPAAAKAVGPVLNIKDSVLTPALVADYHAANVRVYAWTVDDRAVWEAQKEWGIDRFVTNVPARYRGWHEFACTGVKWTL
jgi:glycerophosphoryl diester phosphodiesterase